MTVDGGASGYVRIAAQLIAATFDDARHRCRDEAVSVE